MLLRIISNRKKKQVRKRREKCHLKSSTKCHRIKKTFTKGFIFDCQERLLFEEKIFSFTYSKQKLSFNNLLKTIITIYNKIKKFRSMKKNRPWPRSRSNLCYIMHQFFQVGGSIILFQLQFLPKLKYVYTF
jgi:hypothetical protein